MFEKTMKMLSKANVVCPTDDLVDIRLFGSVLKKPQSECNDVDVLVITKERSHGTLSLKLRNGINIEAKELNAVEHKLYTKSPVPVTPEDLPLHVHHCPLGELELDTCFNSTFRENNISAWGL